MPEEENRDLLSQLAWTNAVLGRIGEAKAAIRDSLQFGVSEPTQRFKEELDRTYPTVQPTVAAGFRFWVSLSRENVRVICSAILSVGLRRHHLVCPSPHKL
jgi:hypothetical protein